MRDGVVALTMAGRSSRFSAAGVTVPKWALKVGGKSLLWWSVVSLEPMFEAGWSLHLVALSEHAASQQFREAVDELPVPASVTGVPVTPPGQALSALAVGHNLDPEVPFAVWNADTHLLANGEAVHMDGGNWLTLAGMPSDHWSFAAVSPSGRVTRTAEKARISDWASVGLYGFSAFSTFARAVGSFHGDQAEMYVAPLYNSLLEAGERVEAVFLPGERVVPFGTPHELVRSCRQLEVSIPEELSSFAESMGDYNSG